MASLRTTAHNDETFLEDFSSDSEAPASELLEKSSRNVSSVLHGQ